MHRLLHILLCAAGATARNNLVEFQVPAPVLGTPANTTFIGVPSAIRQTISGSGSDATANLASILWSYPALVKTALLAWSEDLILEPPTKKVDWDYQIIWVDECIDKARCTESRTLDLMMRVMLGDRLTGQHFPPVAAVVGAWFYTGAVSKLASALQIPMVGYVANEDQLSDKLQHPFFVRTCGTNGAVYFTVLKIVAFFNYTRADFWVCNTPELFFVRDQLATQAADAGLLTMALNVPQSDYTGCPLVGGSDLLKTWRLLLEQSRAFGAHVHIPMFTVKCPLYDLMHYLALNGLVSRGHLWFGNSLALESSYVPLYLGVVGVRLCPLGAPPEQQVVSAYSQPLGLSALDGYTWIASQDLGDRYGQWHKWFQSLKPRRDSIFEAWYAQMIPEVCWNDPQASQWRPPYNAQLFDAIWAVLRGVNSLLLDVGPNFNSTQLLHRIWSDRFDGLTGLVAFDEKGDRQSLSYVRQFRVLKSASSRRLTTRKSWFANDADPDLTQAILRAFAGNPSEDASSSAAHERRDSADACAAPASLANRSVVAAYLDCLVASCSDAAPSVVQAASGGVVQTCLAGKAMIGGNCAFDLSAMASSLPSGTTFGRLCAAQCPCTAAKVTCAAPAGLSDVPLLASYLNCLRNTCEDAAGSLLQAATGGAVSSCQAGKAMIGGNCEMDLSALVPALPAGTRFKDMCPGQCPCQDCAPPTSTRDATAVAAYFQCSRTRCTNVGAAFLQAYSGGSLQSCPGTKVILAGNCDADVSAAAAAFAVGIKVKDICPSECSCTPAGGGAAPAPGPPAWAPPKVSVAVVGEYFGALNLTEPLVFYGGIQQLPPDRELRCATGSFYDSFWARCEVCQEGTFTSSVGATECSLCPAGTYGEGPGRSLCVACSGGRFSGAGAMRCELCAPGNFTNDVQQTQCTKCLPGSFSDTFEAKECRPCAIGFYQPHQGQSECLPCDGERVTRLPGSRRETDCDCGLGYYLNAEGGCGDCSKEFPFGTVNCPGFGSPPILEAGFMTRAGRTEIYLCPVRGDACPGNVPVGTEACSEGGQGLACTSCLDGFQFQAKTGTCVPCNSLAMAIFAVLLLFALIALFWKLRPLEIEYGGATFVRNVKIMFTTVPLVHLIDLFQFHSILGRTSIPWPQQETTFFKTLSAILDFGSFSVECIIGGDRSIYPLRHVILMNLVPAMTILACVVMVLPQFIFPRLRQWRWPAPIPAVQTALSLIIMFFITVLNWALNLVFSTYQHPGGSVRSLRAFPHVLTTDSIMPAMQATAITSILLWCVGTSALVLALLWILPSHRENMFLRRCTLVLVARYSANTACWVLVELGVKILTTITLTIFNSPDAQLTWLTFVYVTYLFMTTWIAPYRYTRHSLSDSVLTLGKILILIMAVPVLVQGGTFVVGMKIATWLFYGLSGLIVAWCAVDFFLGRSCDVEGEEVLMTRVWQALLRVMPVQHDPGEVAKEHCMRMSNVLAKPRLEGFVAAPDTSPKADEETAGGTAGVGDTYPGGLLMSPSEPRSPDPEKPGGGEQDSIVDGLRRPCVVPTDTPRDMSPASAPKREMDAISDANSEGDFEAEGLGLHSALRLFSRGKVAPARSRLPLGPGAIQAQQSNPLEMCAEDATN